MSPAHCIVWIDHQSAQILRFDSSQVQSQELEVHTHHTRQHGSGVRSEHEFFAEVCDALASLSGILVTGGHTAQADFRHYIDKHRPALSHHIASWLTVDHPTEGQLLAIGRSYFAKLEHVVH
jgi:stalled ribosome rescue protein Dom34